MLEWVLGQARMNPMSKIRNRRSSGVLLSPPLQAAWWLRL